MVLLKGGAPRPASAQHLGSMASALVNWLDELRAVGVLVAMGVPESEPAMELTGESPVQGCIIIAVQSDDDARAVADTCPVDAQLRPSIVRMTCEPHHPAALNDR